MTSSEAVQDSASRFFEKLAAQHQPLLRNMSGTLRFDVIRDNETEYWHVTIARGDAAVTRDAGTADSSVRVRAELFDDIVSGRANAMAAVLRGDIGVEGNTELLMRVQRTFPGPEGSTK